MIFSHCSTISLPGSVTEIGKVLRSKIVTFMRSSNVLICWLTVLWSAEHSSAAFEKLPFFATETTYCICLRVTIIIFKQRKLNKVHQKRLFVKDWVFSIKGKKKVPGGPGTFLNVRKCYLLPLAWSARNCANPMSVSGCFNKPKIALSGQVTTSAPFCAHCTMCKEVRTLAAKISVS